MGEDRDVTSRAPSDEVGPTVTRPGSASPASHDALLRPGDRVGHYRILEQIGEGGFAVVYLAEQAQPVRRRVALKIVKLGMDTREVIARFEAERQALALMDHVNVARVFEGGATASGRPYFVMEYVAGTPITEHCDRERSNLRERLELFIQVCKAVQHAHHKAIIHRDIKPSNVLVAGREHESVVKVIDFGVAKAVAHRLTEKTIYTLQGQLVGTPMYMSPEQAEKSGDDIDTRSDVYSLGVLLYELITGFLPFDPASFRSAGLAEIQRIIREEEAPKPSSRMSHADGRSVALARNRRFEPKSLARELRGDLDWITLKALEKERSRRYDSPRDLADDIRRYLDNRTVLASPPSLGYRAGKFARRHAIAVVAASIGGLLLVSFVVAMVIQARRVAIERDVARRAQAELARVVEFQADRLGEIDAQAMGARLRHELQTEVRTALENAGLTEADISQQTASLARSLDQANFTNLALHTLEANIFTPALEAVGKTFADQPLVQAKLLQSLAVEMREAGLLEAALAPLEEAVALYRRGLGDQHPNTLAAINDLGDELHNLGQYADAESAYREALQGRHRVLGPEHPDTILSIGDVGLALKAQGKFDEAEASYRQALQALRRVRGDDHPETLTALNNMASLLKQQGRLDESEVYFREALSGKRRALGDDDRSTLITRSNLGHTLLLQSKLEGAEPHLGEALAGMQRVLGDEHPHTLITLLNVGSLLRQQGRLEEAERTLGEVLEASTDVLGSGHGVTVTTLFELGRVKHARTELAEAESYLRRAVEAGRRGLGPDHPRTLRALDQLAAVSLDQGRHQEAAQLLEATLSIRIRDTGEDHWETAWTRSLLGAASTGLERYEEAESHLRAGYAGLDAAAGAHERSQKLEVTRTRLQTLYQAWGKPEKAARWRAKGRARPAPSDDAGSGQ
jgi:serine/threonine protein kinase/tetratricopeptide (TPR) repeat protein